MADEEWYYQTDGEVHGPVTSSFLKTAYAKGKLRSRDSIRQGEEGEWKVVSTIPQMVKARDKYRKLLAERKSKTQKAGLPDPATLDADGADQTEAASEPQAPGEPQAPAGTRRAVDETLRTDPWYGILTQLLTDVGLMPDPFEPDDRVWFMWVGRKLGPFSFLDLVNMGREGTLKVTDWISHTDSEDWTPLSPEAEAQVDNADQSDPSTDTAMSESSTVAMSDSHVLEPLDSEATDPDSYDDASDSYDDDSADEYGYGPSDSDNAVDSDSGVISPEDSGLYDSALYEDDSQEPGTYGVPSAPGPRPPAPTPRPRKPKPMPLRLPDQIPEPALVEPVQPATQEDEASNLAAKAAAQLLFSPQKKQSGPDGEAGAVRGGGGGGSFTPPDGKKPLADQIKDLGDQIKESGPKGWAVLGVGALVLLYLLSSLLPQSNHAAYQEFLQVYADLKEKKAAKPTRAELEEFFLEAIPRVEKTLTPILQSQPKEGTGAYHLRQGGTGLLIDLGDRSAGGPDYLPWFLQDLKKAADELGYSPPPDVPPGEKPTYNSGEGGVADEVAPDDG